MHGLSSPHLTLTPTPTSPPVAGLCTTSPPLLPQSKRQGKPLIWTLGPNCIKEFTKFLWVFLSSAGFDADTDVAACCRTVPNQTSPPLLPQRGKPLTWSKLYQWIQQLWFSFLLFLLTSAGSDAYTDVAASHWTVPQHPSPPLLPSAIVRQGSLHSGQVVQIISNLTIAPQTTTAPYI